MENLKDIFMPSARQITYRDLQFKQIPITMHSSRGTKYTRWVDIGMPKISPELLDCVFYLYKTREDAEKGEGYGGTGFLVGIHSEQYPDQVYIYGVSNWHVVLSKGYSVIRLNTLDGATDIFEYDPIDWEFFPVNDDIAISPLLPINIKLHKTIFIETSAFVNDDNINTFEIGVGDDVFMLGRFVDYDGGVTNLPSARFGNISIMPAPIKQPTNYMGKSYCIDLHSRAGYSGSPVFVYRTPGCNLDETYRTGKLSSLYFLCLLGIHWGQFPEHWELISQDKLNKSETSSLVTDGKYVKGLSGMTLVIPAQRILDLLNIPKYKEQRKKGDIQLTEDYKKHGFPPEPEAAEELIPSTDNPQHKEDFNSLVTAAAKKKPQADET